MLISSRPISSAPISDNGAAPTAPGGLVAALYAEGATWFSHGIDFRPWFRLVGVAPEAGHILGTLPPRGGRVRGTAPWPTIVQASTPSGVTLIGRGPRLGLIANRLQ